MEVTVTNMSRERFLNLVERCKGQVLIHLRDGSTFDVKQNAAVLDTLGLPAGQFQVRFDAREDYKTVVLSLIGFLR